MHLFEQKYQLCNFGKINWFQFFKAIQIKKMLQKNLCSTTETSSSFKKNKVLCTSCGHSFPSYQFDFHYEECQGEDDYIIYHPEEENCQKFIGSIDMMDLPLSGTSVQLKGLSKLHGKNACKLPIVPYLPKKGGLLKCQKCSLCANSLEKGQKQVVLPCGHRLQYSCLKKWSIIVEPCRICCKSQR